MARLLVRGPVLYLVVTLGLVAVAVAVALSPARPARAADDNPTVCREVGETLNTGLEQFVADMEQVSSQAQSGDLASAESTVRHAGGILSDMASKLYVQGDADDPALHKAVADLAAELASLGAQLNSLSGLQAFETSKLGELADAVGKICGTTFGPSASPSASPGASPGASPTRTGPTRTTTRTTPAPTRS